MNDIFVNAYLGKPYRTRDGRKALVWYYHVGQDIIDQVVLITTNARQICVDGSGKDINEPYHNTLNDIVSEWQEPIDEEKLDELAEHWCPESGSYREGDIETQRVIRNAFKAGYRKAMEVEE